jgi:hypothetical protein
LREGFFKSLFPSFVGRKRETSLFVNQPSLDAVPEGPFAPCKGASFMIAYAIDTRYYDPKDPDYYSKAGVWNKDYVVAIIWPGIKMDTVVQMIINSILAAGAGRHSVEKVRLAGHGNSGYMQFGEGLWDSNADEFEKLAPYLTVDQYKTGIELHGCGVGSSTAITAPGSSTSHPSCVPGTSGKGKGYDLLLALAKAVNRNSAAGINCQLADSDWKFEGPYMIVNPNGSYGVVS